MAARRLKVQPKLGLSDHKTHITLLKIYSGSLPATHYDCANFLIGYDNATNSHFNVPLATP